MRQMITETVLGHFASRFVGLEVMRIAESLTNACLSIGVNTSDKSKGPCVIVAHGLLLFDDAKKLRRCVLMAHTLYLADLLRAKNPRHPLCNVWHLKPENRSRIYRPVYRIDQRPLVEQLS